MDSESVSASASDTLADRLEDMAMQASSRQGRGKGGGRGGRGGRGGGERGRAVDLSKALSRLLRHQAGNAGIELDKEGYADLEKVVSTHFPPPPRS